SRGLIGWLDFVFIALGVAMVLLLVLHLRQRIPFIPESWIGKGQLFYLVFLWTMIAINFMLVIPRFTPIRLVTEWFMTLNAIACTVLLVYFCFARATATVEIAAERSYAAPFAHLIRNAVICGILGAAVVSFGGWRLKMGLYGEHYAGIPGGKYLDDIQFGPNN